jgi:protein SCO1/2
VTAPRPFLCAAVLALASCARRPPGFLDPEPAPAIDGIAVKSGAPFRLGGEIGKVVLVSFGYTSCVEVCPITFATAEGVLRALDDRADRVEFVYVSVDPERDDPTTFRAFMAGLDPRFQGVYVDEGRLPPLLADWHVTVRKRVPDPARYARREQDRAAFYSMDHTAGFWGVDARGRLRFRYGHDTAASEVAAATRRLVEEGG